MTNTIDRHLLARTAQDILTGDLETRGNILSDMHRAALFELVDHMAGYTTGEESGRKAFPLPTGMGKTSALVAFTTALDRLGYSVPVSVAASKVEALCSIKRELIAHGVPPDRVGLKHAVPGASEPSTGNDERLFQLVTHVRVRSGRDFDLFGTYQGKPRALCLYDETLLRADVLAFNELQVRMALGALGPLAEDRGDMALTSLHAYLVECSGIIKATLDALMVSGDPLRQGMPVELPFREEATLQAWAALLPKNSRELRGQADVLGQLLAVSQESLQVLTTEQGRGVISVRQAVPAALRDVVILDASGPIRELARMDPSVAMVESFAPEDLKSFEAVEVHQLLASGGRNSVEQSFTMARQETAAISREVLGIMRQDLKEDPDRAFLVFSFVKRGSLDVQAQLKTDLQRAGVDLASVTREGKPRYEFLTWGQHEGLNGYEHCTTVILAGVLHRAHMDISAMIKGQQNHLQAPTPGDLVRHVVESELAHAVYQAASRGSCRRVNNGKARAMRLYLIHRGLGLKTMLDKVMPGAVWSWPEPQHLRKATADGRAAAMLGQLLEYLRTVPETIQKLSSKAVKVGLNITGDRVNEDAFKDAAGALELSRHGWVRDGRSLVRGSIAYGFTDQA